MRRGLRFVPNDWQLLGAELAQADSNDQVAFFQAFVRECLSWGTHYQVEQQLAAVNIALSKDEKQVLSMLGFEEDQC